MEPNALPGGMYSTMGSGMLGLEMSLHHQPPQAQVVAFGHHEADHHHHPPRKVYQFTAKSKPQKLNLSDDDDEDDPGINAEDSADGKRKISPQWQRMKWNDCMVRLLIMMVLHIGEEACSEANDQADGKKQGGSGVVLQKKGKWKSVSRAMLERGFCVSPQQCEDKFNDLNKRYKRVNDLLGKGTACRVVENRSLLDAMDHLSPKRKEEVKKLLNSKHLFFREMCAYHNSCGGGGNFGAPHSPEVAAEPSQQIQQPLQHQKCFHSIDNTTIEATSERAWSTEEEEEDDDGDEDDDEDEQEEEEGGGGGEKYLRKRQRKGISGLSSSPLIRQMSNELMSVIQDGGKSLLEKGQWLRSQLSRLEEQRASYQFEAFEIEKQRLKWVKFSSKKEMEMEKHKLKNERMRLQNERMLLLVRQKELELLHLQQQQQQQISSNKDT